MASPNASGQAACDGQTLELQFEAATAGRQVEEPCRMSPLPRWLPWLRPQGRVRLVLEGNRFKTRFTAGTVWRELAPASGTWCLTARGGVHQAALRRVLGRAADEASSVTTWPA